MLLRHFLFDLAVYFLSISLLFGYFLFFVCKCLTNYLKNNNQNRGIDTNKKIKWIQIHESWSDTYTHTYKHRCIYMCDGFKRWLKAIIRISKKSKLICCCSLNFCSRQSASIIRKVKFWLKIVFRLTSS